jgi:hypothetical protein
MKPGPLMLWLLFSSFAAATLAAQTIPATKAASSNGKRVSESPTLSAPKLAILVFDFAQVDQSVLLSARRVATEIFNESGIKTEWFNCHTSLDCDLQADRAQFRLIIQSQVGKVVRDRSQARDLTDSHALGFAIPCKTTDSACLFYIFYSPINSLASQYGASSGCILGQVMVHEIGHSLLGTDAHSRTGIMQPRFPIPGTDRLLYFSSRESKRARDQLSMRNESIKNRFAGLNTPLLVANSKN